MHPINRRPRTHLRNDLIVVGTHGRGEAASPGGLGDVVQRVLAAATRFVLTVTLTFRLAESPKR
jgi:hypothetical protein